MEKLHQYLLKILEQVLPKSPAAHPNWHAEGKKQHLDLQPAAELTVPRGFHRCRWFYKMFRSESGFLTHQFGAHLSWRAVCSIDDVLSPEQPLNYWRIESAAVPVQALTGSTTVRGVSRS
jgi:hypothetical protein